jgi:hypothetical protein
MGNKTPCIPKPLDLDLEKININTLLLLKLTEFYKLTKIVVNQMMGNVKSEWIFPTLTLMKIFFKNILWASL